MQRKIQHSLIIADNREMKLSNGEIWLHDEVKISIQEYRNVVY